MTLKNPNLPDAGWDPIASETVPFSGDFWMAEDYAVHTNYIKPATGTTGTSVTVCSDKFNVSGDSEFAKTIIVDGYEYIHGADDDDYGLKVDNKIYVGSGVDIAGDLDISGNLYVTGEGKTAYIKNLSAEFATITSATITKVDIVESESYGYIMHTTAVAPKIIDTQSLTAGVNNFYLSGDTLYSDSWGYFEGELKTASAFYADGPVTFANTLNVTGKATFDNEILAASSITTNKNLYVTGNAKVGAFGSFGTYVSAAGSDNNGYGLIIEKNANIKGNTDIGGTLGVTGAVDFDSTLNVDGATTLNTLNATGAVDFDSTLNVDGATTLNSLDVTNNATVGGTLGVTGATTLSSTLGVTGATTLNSTLNVSGDTTTTKLAVSGMLGVTGEVSMANNLRVDGYTTMNNKLLIASGGCDIIGAVSATNVISTNTGFYLVKGSDTLCSIHPNGSKFSISADDATLLEYYGIDIEVKAPNVQKALRINYNPTDTKWAIKLANSPNGAGNILYIPNLAGTLARIEDINSSLTAYATKQYVDDKIGDINTILDEINGEEI